MHDPLVVAFEIRRPWPAPDDGLSGRRYHPPVVTIWHREPGGHDSGEVCKHFRRVFDESDRTWKHQPRRAWKFHVHHYRLQLHPVQDFRRWALTRCAWCGGRSRKGDYVNCAHQWNGPRGHWWQGEPGLFHMDCSSVEHAHRMCFCPEPLTLHEGYGKCRSCGGFRAYGQVPDEADRLLRDLPRGSRIPLSLRPKLDAMWAERRARKEAA